MSLGKDLVNVGKDAREVYRAAKKLKKDVDAEGDIAQQEIDALTDKIKALTSSLAETVQSPPNGMTGREYKAFLKESVGIVGDRIKNQRQTLEYEELMKLYSQKITLENSMRTIILSELYDIRGVLPADWTQDLVEDVKAAHKEVKKRLKARGYARIGIRSAIFVVDLAVALAKAA